MINQTFVLRVIIALSFLSFTVVQAQQTLRFNSNVKAIVNGDTLKNSFAGGTNTQIYNPIDLDFDGHLDLMVFDRTGNSFRTYINVGNYFDAAVGDSLINYQYAPEYEEWFYPFITFFEPMNNFCLLRDWNCDGMLDAFTSTSGGMKVYTNIGSEETGHKFALETPLLYTSSPNGNYYNIHCIAIDIPAIDDIDGDGDLDILVWNSIFGTYIEYYENVSNSCDSLNFMHLSECWGHFHENLQTEEYVLDSSCGNSSHHGPQRHSGTTLFTFDADNDNDKEVMIGNFHYKDISLLYNGGDSSHAFMDSVYYYYEYGVPVDMQFFPAAYSVQVDTDEENDLVFGVNDYNFSTDTISNFVYTNVGHNDSSIFSYAKKGFIDGEQLDVGTGNYLQFTDINSDGLVDIVSGNYGYFYVDSLTALVANPKSRVAVFHNVGTSNEPVFELVTRDYMNLSQEELLGLTPVFVDLDADGDDDMILGESLGSFMYFENQATPGSPAQYVLTNPNFFGVQTAPNPHPMMYDFDGDGDLDFASGHENGHITYFENLGDSANPIFINIPTVDSLGGIGYNGIFGNSRMVAPSVLKIDSTQLPRLVIGDGLGKVKVYEMPDPSDLGAVVTLLDSFTLGGGLVVPANANFTADTTILTAFGFETGGISFYHIDSAWVWVPDTSQQDTTPGDTGTPGDSSDTTSVLNLITPDQFFVSPNPAQNEVRVKAFANTNEQAKVKIIDVTGRVLKEFILPANELKVWHPIDIKALQGGIYFLQLEIGNDRVTKRFIKA